MSRVNPWKITGYKAGQNVVCKVSHAEPGGYAVIIPKDNLPGFLPTEQPLKAGEEVLAQFVCVSNSRILLQCRFGTNNKNGAKHQTVNWEEQLDQIDGRSGEKIDYSHRPSVAAAPEFPSNIPQQSFAQPSAFAQEQSYAQEFDNEPASQDPYAHDHTQDPYAQNQYGQEPYADDAFSSGQYAQNYAEAQGQFEQPQPQYELPQQQGYDNPQQVQPNYAQNNNGQPDQFGTQSGRFQPLAGQSQPGQGGQNQPPGGYQAAQSYQGGSQSGQGQLDYSQQNMQFTPQQPGAAQGVPSQSAFTAAQGGMQFKPQMPADFAETQNQWSSQSNLTPATPPQMVPPVTQNPYQAPMQAAAQYQAAPLQSQPPAFQSPTQSAVPAPFPSGAQNVSGGFQASMQPSQYQPPASAPGQYNSGSQPAAGVAYQSPASYQGPTQSQVPPPAQAPQPTPNLVPAAPPAALPAPLAPPETAAPTDSSAADDWGYAGQGWDDGVRLTKAPPAEVMTSPAVPASEADAAFRVWAPKAQTREFHLKRATDLVPPAFDMTSLATFTAEEQDLEWLITDIEGGMRTGCVKAISETSMSRSAALLFKGRAVGCIYGRKKQPENYGTEQSLQIMMQDLEKPDTQVELYDLPDSVVLPMSALFLGYPVPKEENVDARTYMDYMCNWFASKAQTACLAITFPSRSATCLCFIHDGVFCGAFYVEEQKFTTDKEFVYSLMQTDPQASVEASILPPEMTSSAVRFGFNLSMARKKGY